MKAIDFVVRTGAGAVQFGEIAEKGGQTRVAAEPNGEISLNLRQSDVAGYQRQGADLAITLADGRVVLIEDYFSGDLPVSRLFISADGYLNEVTLVEGSGGSMYAQYGPTAEWGKWSPDEALIFLNEGDALIAPNQVAGAVGGDDDVSMLAAIPLLGALGAGGTAAAAAAVVGGAVLAGSVLNGGDGTPTDQPGGGGTGGGGTGGGGGTPPTRIEPSVNEKDQITRDGADEKTITITGRAEPGSTVTVVIGGETVTTTSNGDGNWQAGFTGTDFPADGGYNVAVTVVEPTGITTNLPGPPVVIDTTPPLLDFTDGTQSTTHVVNAADHANGVDIAGTSEAGATVAVTVAGVTKTTTAAADGTWTVSYTPTEIVGGEYTVPVTVVTTDSFGNAASYTDTLVVDTIPHPITIATAIVGGEGTVNSFDALNGVTVTGTSTPGAVLAVEIGGNTQTVTAGANGAWSASWAAGVIAGGEYDAVVNVSTVDAAGNPSSATGSFRMDTVGMVTITAGPIAGNDVVNAAEAASDIILTGTTQPGSSVTVQIDGVTRTATVAADGTWTATFQAGSLRAGTYDTSVDVTATDAAGNIALATRQISVDTQNTLTIGLNAAGGDAIINAAERSAGVTLTGDTQPGSTVSVSLGGVSRPATVNFDGTWSVTFAAADIPTGTRDLAISATSTDRAGNVSTATSTIALDTENAVTITNTGGGTDSVVNAAERTAGVVITGQAEAGSTAVAVTLNGKTHAATVAADGSWQVAVAAADLPTGERSVDVNVTATDRAGNTATATSTLAVDTVPHPISIATALVGGNGTVNGTEAAGGVTVTGTSTPGAVLAVEIGGNSQNVTVAADGRWTATWAAGVIPGGEYDAVVNVTTTDAAGNPSSATGTFRMDTVGMVTISAAPIAGNDVVNAGESAAGVTLTGTTQPGSTVTVQIDGVTRTATVAADGTWSATFAAGSLRAGTYATSATVTATDAAGNVAQATRAFTVDTQNAVAISANNAGGDNIINAAERTAGVTLTGTTDAGSSVVITLGDASRAATVAADGTWTVTFPSSQVPQGTRDLAVTATSTDAQGNVARATSTIALDTENVVTVTDTGGGADGVVNAAERAAGIIIAGQAEPGTVAVSLDINGRTHTATVAADGKWQVALAEADLPTGERDLQVGVSATDRAGNVATVDTVLDLDTLVNRLTAASESGGTDRIINAAEHGAGVIIRGQVEAGSTVSLRIGTNSVNATVAADGSWTATFPAAQVPRGDLTVPVTATATDAAGNVLTSRVLLKVDTIFNSLALGPDPVEGNNVINFREAQDGATITGTSDANAIVSVTFGSATRQVVTNAQGAWSANFLAAELPADTENAPITATTTDAAGNVTTVTGSVTVDTRVDNLGIAIDPINGLDVINADALTTGVVLTGTTEPGSTSVLVNLDGKVVTATVTPDGRWTAVFDPANLPSGEKTATLSVTATDRNGNVGTVSNTVRVDTFVNRLENSATPVEGDNVVNAAEARDGVRLTGRVEVGSAVTIVHDGVNYTATVARDGTWTADIPASAIRAGDYDTTVVINATDAAGNTASISRMLSIDTEVPDVANVLNQTRLPNSVAAITVADTTEDLTVSELTADGTIIVDRATGVDVPALGGAVFGFAPAVPDGSHLIVNNTDAAGNTSGTYLVLDELTTSVVDLPAGLAAHQIEAIDLRFAEDSQLTITEAQLRALSDNTDSLLVHGGTDDTVTARGAVAAGSVQVAGQGYVVYTLGADGRLIIDDDIQVLI